MGMMVMRRADMRIDCRRKGCMVRSMAATCDTSRFNGTTSLTGQEAAVVPCQAPLVVRQCSLCIGGITTIGIGTALGRTRSSCQGDGSSESSHGIQRIHTGLLFIKLAQFAVRRSRLALVPTQQEDCTIVLKAGRVCPLTRIRGGGNAHAVCRG